MHSAFARRPISLNRFIAASFRHGMLPGLLVVWLVALAGCSRQSTVCATDPPNLPVEQRQALSVQDGSEQAAIEIRVRNRPVRVDQIVHGSLCDAEWSGTVYVDCDVTVPEWDPEQAPTFFEGCDLTIEDNTVVYVAYHNDEAYYTGCSCHFEE